MPFVPVPNTIQCNIRATVLDQLVENTLYFNVGVVPTPTTVQNVAGALRDVWEATYLLAASNEYQFREVYAVDLTTNDGPTATFTPVGSGLGQQLGPVLPNNVALCVSFRTARRGRSFRGRNFVPAIRETDVTDNQFSEAAIARYVAAYEDVQTGMAGLSFVMCVVSRNTNNAARTAGIAEPITAILSVDDVVDSQRRRLPGRGR